MKAIEAGCDMVDTAVSSLALDRDTIPTESLVEMLEGTGYTTRLDMERMLKRERLLHEDPPRYKEFLSEFTAWIRKSSRARFPAA